MIPLGPLSCACGLSISCEPGTVPGHRERRKGKTQPLPSSCLECAGKLGLQTLDTEAEGEAEGCRRHAVRTKEKEQMAWWRRDTMDRYLKLTGTLEPDEEETEGAYVKAQGHAVHVVIGE